MYLGDRYVVVLHAASHTASSTTLRMISKMIATDYRNCIAITIEMVYSLSKLKSIVAPYS